MIKQRSMLSRRWATPMVAIAAITTATASFGAAPLTAEELKAREDALTASVKRGYDMWYGARADMANNGLACANCHPDAAATNPQTFPKFLPMFNKVVTYRAMVNWCIQNPQGGKVMDVNSDDMTALEAYSFYLHRGAKIDTGLVTRQTASPTPANARGFNVKGTGIGFDK
jgi:thiosulfate dehydrogenase